MMKVFRYEGKGDWFKGNTHIHTGKSDDGMDALEVAELYAGAGYDFLFSTDSWEFSNERCRQPDDYPLLWLDGLEISGQDDSGSSYHVICLGKVEGVSQKMSIGDGIKKARDQGAFMVLAHPFWSANSFEDCFYHEFDAVEIYNHDCHWANGKGNGLVHWQAMLDVKQDILGVAADGARHYYDSNGWNGGWIVVKADNCCQDNLIDSIRKGSFYSSTGPKIESIEYRNGAVHFTTSPVRFARLVGPGWCGQRIEGMDGRPITEGSFEILENWPYAYLEFEDDAGGHAWTNTLFS